jgi:diguanylate cyclase
VRKTDQTLVEQMHITDFEIEHRKDLFSLTEADIQALRNSAPLIEEGIDGLVAKFYALQTDTPEIALLIGDADSLLRLQKAQRQYIRDLFSGLYDLEYVNNRLRIGLVHKRIGVDSKLYLSAINMLKQLLFERIRESCPTPTEHLPILSALDKLLMFDISFVFETYIRSLIDEIEISKNKLEQYAYALEEKVKDRTQKLEKVARTDPLTGLLNTRHLSEILTRTLRSAQRRSEPVTVVYIDVNDFKKINDTQGHRRGDEILRVIGTTIQSISRMEDSCFRYGGDEFCIILPNCDSVQAEEIYMSRLNSEIKQQLADITLSVGIMQTGPGDYLPPEALIGQADQQMYSVKLAYKSKK